MGLDRDGILRLSATDVATGTAAATSIVHTHQAQPDDDAADTAARALMIE
jgi:hypothetical protein